MNPISPKSTALILVNTGSPAQPTPAAVKTYLAQFLMDPNVVDLPAWFWKPILNGIVLRTRPVQSAKKYQQIWQPEGSPLLIHTNKLREKLQILLQETHALDLTVHTAMLYGQPSLQAILSELKQTKNQNIIVLPLFPQYASATTASIIDLINHTDLAVTVLAHYFDHPAYIAALAQHITAYWKQHPPTEKILFSFHGLPVKRIQHGDPYQDQCFYTVKKLAENLNLSAESYSIGFQSRFGGGRWLQPETEQTLAAWAKQGIQNVQVITPGFTIDCLETLYEIQIELAQNFQNAGGEMLQYIPALNADDLHVFALAKIIDPFLDKSYLWT